MIRISSFYFLCVTLFLTACGGGGDTSSSSSGGNGSSTTLNKFDISSYEPTASVETNSLTGTWLFVGSYDIEYRYETAHEENEYRELELNFRATVSIVEDSDSLTAYAVEGRVFLDEITVFRDEEAFIMEMPWGTFVGNISNNTMVTGTMTSDMPNTGSGSYVTVNSSDLGMVKISSVPVLPGITEGYDELGTIQATIDYDTSVEGSVGDDETVMLPIHYVWEEEGVWREFENGEQLTEDVWYELWVYTVLDNTSLPDVYYESEVENLIIRNTIREDHSLEEYPLGWAISEDILNVAGEYGYISGLSEPIVQTSNTEFIMASYSEVEDGVSELSIDISIQF